MIRWTFLVLLAAAVAGCGGGGDDEPDAGDEAGPAVQLTIVVTDDAGEREATLECEPEGGTHPDPEEACRALAANVGALEPVPQDVACTQQYGGPERARITGAVRDRAVEAELNRANGCEISRWDHLEALLDVRAAER